MSQLCRWPFWTSPSMTVTPFSTWQSGYRPPVTGNVSFSTQHYLQFFCCILDCFVGSCGWGQWVKVQHKASMQPECRWCCKILCPPRAGLWWVSRAGMTIKELLRPFSAPQADRKLFIFGKIIFSMSKDEEHSSSLFVQRDYTKFKPACQATIQVAHTIHTYCIALKSISYPLMFTD